MTLSSDALIQVILYEATLRGVTAPSMAKMTDISLNSCQKLLSGKARRPTLDTVIGLADVAGIKIVVSDSTGRRLL